jgi:Mn-dependent DtxR family transcriptional regulator
MSFLTFRVRDTARVLGISPTTVIHELKKKGLR